VIALLFSTYVYRTFQRVVNVRPPETQHIVVADHPMQVGERLETSSLRLIPWPGNEPISGSFARIQDCAGRALITPVAENEPILETKLAPRAAGAGLPAAIPEGMRAVSVAVNDVIGVAGFVIPGTVVDVLVTGPIQGGSGNQNNITRTILENIRVLAAGQQSALDRSGKPQNVPVVTLLVTPDEAAKLTMASTEGKIQLALRNTIDTQLANPEPVLQTTLFAGAAPPPVTTHSVAHKEAPPKPPAPYTVEIITGTKKETKSFDNNTQNNNATNNQ